MEFVIAFCYTCIILQHCYLNVYVLTQTKCMNSTDSVDYPLANTCLSSTANPTTSRLRDTTNKIHTFLACTVEILSARDPFQCSR